MTDLPQALKAAVLEIREAVAAHGNVHPVVLEKLEAYIKLLQQAGNTEEATKYTDKANQIRKALGTVAASPAPAAAPALAPAPAPVPKPEPKAPVPDGVFSLDDADEAEMSNEALEQAALEAAVSRPAPEAAPASEAGSPDVKGENPIHLYNPGGEHIATAFKAFLYSPEGKNIGRYNDDFEVFLDRTGRYLGQIYEGNRLVRDPNFKFASFSFGDRGNEGDRAGWGRTTDINRTIIPNHLDPVSFNEDN